MDSRSQDRKPAENGNSESQILNLHQLFFVLLLLLLLLLYICEFCSSSDDIFPATHAQY